MTNNLLQPVEVVRDPSGSGYWDHPVFSQYWDNNFGDAEGVTKEQWDGLLKHFGVEITRVDMADDEAVPISVCRRYWDEGDPDAIADWNPITPEGTGWFLIAINDTEDGPAAWFARALKDQISDLQAEIGRLKPAYDSLHKDYIQAVQEVDIAHENHSEAVELLQQQLAAKVPEGVVLVPVEPTEAMIEAGNDRWLMTDGNAAGYWEAIIRATHILGMSEPLNADVKLQDEIKVAIEDYYKALNNRQHGGLAAHHALLRIEAILGMSWDEYNKENMLGNYAILAKESS